MNTKKTLHLSHTKLVKGRYAATLIIVALIALLALTGCSNPSSSEGAQTPPADTSSPSPNAPENQKVQRTATFTLHSDITDTGNWTYSMNPEGTFKEMSHESTQLTGKKDDTMEDVYIFESQKSAEEAVVIFTHDSTEETAEFHLTVHDDLSIVNDYAEGSAYYIEDPDIN